MFVRWKACTTSEHVVGVRKAGKRWRVTCVPSHRLPHVVRTKLEALFGAISGVVPAEKVQMIGFGILWLRALDLSQLNGSEPRLNSSSDR
jgi:hypothetical protein